MADSEGNVTKLHEEGVDLLDSNENGFLTDENGISFYDLSGNLQWSFNKYDVSSAWLYGKNVFVKLNGNDGNTYISNIDQKTGELVYEPIRIFNDEITGKYMVDIRSNKDNLEIVNLVNGKSKNTIKVSAKYISKSKVKYSGNGIFVFSTISEKNNYLFVCLFVTNILENGTYVLYSDRAKDILESAFNIDNIEEGKFLKGIVSRKLQILPKLMNDME